ncbi:MAG TPA: hypothetical protein VL974_08425 [Magnetospirillum sp.]|jgi:hypothetical protein|nr:hypothetical protein [Magnetospirillum sp.]
MALGTGRVSAVAAPGMAAAATARPLSGGRNVASVSGGVEGADFSPQIGVDDNRLWRYDDEQTPDFGQQKKQDDQATPFVSRLATAFQVGDTEESTEAGGAGRISLFQMIYGIAMYEANLKITMAGGVRPGSVLNSLF